MSHTVDELWTVAGTTPHVDADALARAVEGAVGAGEALDYRTRLLIRDSMRALESHWGHDRFAGWLKRSSAAANIEHACDPGYFDPDPSEIGYPSLEKRIVDAINRETLLEFFRTLSLHVHQPTMLVVGGSISLMLNGLLTRRTEDIDIVNEVPAALRSQHDLLEQLANRFGLVLAHFQSHYLPSGWERRVRSFQVFDSLDVRVVDPYDVMISKLCSKRTKDLDDLRALKPHIARDLLKARLIEAGAPLLAEPRLRAAAEENWYVLFGEPLPA